MRTGFVTSFYNVLIIDLEYLAVFLSNQKKACVRPRKTQNIAEHAALPQLFKNRTHAVYIRFDQIDKSFLHHGNALVRHGDLLSLAVSFRYRFKAYHHGGVFFLGILVSRLLGFLFSADQTG